MGDEAKANLGKDEVEISKLQEEIKSLKQQRLLTILSVIGAVIAFMLTNTERISDIIYHKPKVQVTTEDEYLRKNAILMLTSHGENGSVVVSDALSSSPKWFSINPGVYHLTVTVFGKTAYEQDFTVDKGETRIFTIPKIEGANIRVLVDNRSGHVGPGSQLEFQVVSSGNGYVWVFEKRTQEYALIYPESCPTDCGNEISVSQGLHLPDQQQRALFAGRRAGEETLLFLVTSSADSDSAKRIAGQFTSASILKAFGGITKDNWGFAEVSYNVLLH